MCVWCGSVVVCAGNGIKLCRGMVVAHVGLNFPVFICGRDMDIKFIGDFEIKRQQNKKKSVKTITSFLNDKKKIKAEKQSIFHV